MKKALVILLSLSLALGASAQGKVYRGGARYVRPRVTVITPIYPSYSYGYGYRFSPFYSPYYDPFAFQRYEATPSKLDLHIEDIQNDYQYQISTVRHDKSLSGPERRQRIRDLKHQREDAIIQAKENYYNSNRS